KCFWFPALGNKGLFPGPPGRESKTASKYPGTFVPLMPLTFVMHLCESMRKVDHADCEKLLSLTSILYSPGQSDFLRRQLLTSLQSLIPHDLGACHWMQPSRHEIAAWYEPQRRPLPSAHHDFWPLIETHPLNPMLFS